MVKKKKDEGQGGNGVPASRSPPVYLFAQVLKVPCTVLSHTSLHAPYINWGPHHWHKDPISPAPAPPAPELHLLLQAPSCDLRAVGAATKPSLSPG